MNCPHLLKCKQKITEYFFSRCLGEEEDWFQDDCFRFNDLGRDSELNHKLAERKLPKEWKANKQ
jgi:hypothetical protein